jgi:hypothetical protein
LDHACTICFVFANYFWKVFSKYFANSQRYMNRLHEAFSRFEISPPFSNDFPLTKQNSP